MTSLFIFKISPANWANATIGVFLLSGCGMNGMTVQKPPSPPNIVTQAEPVQASRYDIAFGASAAPIRILDARVYKVTGVLDFLVLNQVWSVMHTNSDADFSLSASIFLDGFPDCLLDFKGGAVNSTTLNANGKREVFLSGFISYFDGSTQSYRSMTFAALMTQTATINLCGTQVPITISITDLPE